MRVPLLAGREFSERDDGQAPKVVMVNQTLARRFWPKEDPIGKHILLGRATLASEVIGMLGDVRNASLAADVSPEIYLPFPQLPWASMNLVVRTAGDPHGFVAAARGRVLAVDKEQPVTAVATMDEVMEQAAAQPRFTAWLLSALAAMALVLARGGAGALVVVGCGWGVVAGAGGRAGAGARRGGGGPGGRGGGAAR